MYQLEHLQCAGDGAVSDTHSVKTACSVPSRFAVHLSSKAHGCGLCHVCVRHHCVQSPIE